MKLKENVLLAIVIVCIACLSRLVTHEFNFTAVGAAALFASAYLGRRLAFVVPIAAIFISNIFLNNLIYAEYFDGFTLFDPRSLPSYIAFALIIIAGMAILKKVTVMRVAGSALAAAVIFYLVTNFGSWLGSGMYPMTFGGLIESYVAGIPFFRYTLISNFVFSAILFGAYELYMSRSLRPAKSPNNA